MRPTSRNKWKYATIGLMTVLAVGFSFPQAFAHVTTSLAHNVQHILNAVAALQSDVDDLASDIETLDSKVDGLDSTPNVKSFTAVLDSSTEEFVILEASFFVSTAVVSATVRFEASGVTENDTDLTFLCDSSGEGSLQDGEHEYLVSCEKIWIKVSGLTNDSVTITGTAVYDVDPA